MNRAIKIAVGVLVGIGVLLIVMFIVALVLISKYDFYKKIEAAKKEGVTSQ